MLTADTLGAAAAVHAGNAVLRGEGDGSLFEALDAIRLLVAAIAAPDPDGQVADPAAIAAFTAKRRRLGWGLRDVESESGVSFSTLARFERGERIGAGIAAGIATWVRDPDPKEPTLSGHAAAKRIEELEQQVAGLTEAVLEAVRICAKWSTPSVLARLQRASA